MSFKDGVATRRFEKGLVAVNATEREATIPLPKPHRDRGGASVQQLVLSPKSGEILFSAVPKLAPHKGENAP